MDFGEFHERTWYGGRREGAGGWARGPTEVVHEAERAGGVFLRSLRLGPARHDGWGPGGWAGGGGARGAGCRPWGALGGKVDLGYILHVTSDSK